MVGVRRGLPARSVWQLQQGPFLDEDAIDHELVQHFAEALDDRWPGTLEGEEACPLDDRVGGINAVADAHRVDQGGRDLLGCDAPRIAQ